MQNTRNRLQNQNMKKNIAIMIAVLVAILLIFLIALHYIQTKEEEKQEAFLSGQFRSIQDILEYYGCELKRTRDSELENFSMDIYAIMKYDLYTDDESNEDFYQNVLEEIAKFLNYSSFRLIDESKEEKIEIQVFCGNSKIQKIVINGIEDYFIYMDSQINLKKYKELKTTDFYVESAELINCLQNNWSTETSFGTRETIFQNYYVYFDEGIQARTIDSKIYNIVFTNRYQNPVINGLTVGLENKTIIANLGEPTFQNEDQSIIGYKSDEMYVFFEADQISVYRNTQEGKFSDFLDLVDDFLEEKYTFKEFMNELTDIWPDYEEYTYDESSVFLSYPNRGIDIKLNYENMDGIILYNNVGMSQTQVNDYLEHTEFVAQLQVDNVYNAEKRRVEKQKEWSTKCTEYQEEYEAEDARNRGETYDYYMKMSSNGAIMSVYFISKDPAYPNCELNDNIESYVWLNDYCFVYSIYGRGIYYYDLKNQTKGVIVTGDETYQIKSYEDGVLRYDGTSRELQY